MVLGAPGRNSSLIGILWHFYLLKWKWWLYVVLFAFWLSFFGSLGVWYWHEAHIVPPPENALNQRALFFGTEISLGLVWAKRTNNLEGLGRSLLKANQPTNQPANKIPFFRGKPSFLRKSCLFWKANIESSPGLPNGQKMHPPDTPFPGEALILLNVASCRVLGPLAGRDGLDGSSFVFRAAPAIA